MEINNIRHSLAHILAAAVQNLYPESKFGIGPAIENGFYYDIELPQKISPTDLPKIEKEMKRIIKKNIPFKKKTVSKEKAKTLFKNQPYKKELIREMPAEKVTVYESGDFVDLCKGPHVKFAKEINPANFKLTKVAGAYWRGDEKNPMLTRIYGVAFENKKDLQKYLELQKEAEKRDHRKLGRELELFLLDEEVGMGLPVWLPRGSALRNVMENHLKEKLTKQGYKWLYTPHIGKIDLWKKSGHWNFYKENLYSPIEIDKEKYLLKPMNCPFHVKAYSSKIRSYRDLPIYFAELGTVYRYERSGTLHGLTRVRGFTQDDAHIFCTPEQIKKEVEKLVKYGLEILKNFGFKEYNIYLSTRPEKYAGSLKSWKHATDTLKKVLEEQKLNYETDQGGGVFYGPKIDIKIKDSLGREWQCTTIQFDFNLPQRFGINYTDKKGEKREPFMIHRALLGSIERFTGVLIEHYAGAFPLWLSPVQVSVVPVGSSHRKYAEKIQKELSDNNIRSEAKTRAETVGRKIREGEKQKIPYILIVGDKEKKSESVRVRKRKEGDLGMIKIATFIKRIKKEIEEKK